MNKAPLMYTVAIEPSMRPRMARETQASKRFAASMAHNHSEQIIGNAAGISNNVVANGCSPKINDFSMAASVRKMLPPVRHTPTKPHADETARRRNRTPIAHDDLLRDHLECDGRRLGDAFPACVG